MTESTARPSAARAVGSAAVLTIVLLELTRLWLPGAPVLLSAVALPRAALVAATVVPFLAGGLALLPAVRRRWRGIWRRALLTLAVVRALAMVLPHSQVRLGLLVVGVAIASLAVALLATRHLRSGPPRLGLLLGMVVHVLVGPVTGTIDPLWQHGPLAWGIGGVLVAALVTVAWAGPGGSMTSAGMQPSRAGSWLLVVPLLVLVAALTASPGRLAVLTGWLPWQLAVAIAAAHVLAVLAARLAPLLGTARAGLAGAAGVLVGTAGALPPRGWISAGSIAVLCAGLGLLMGTDPTAAPRPARPHDAPGGRESRPEGAALRQGAAAAAAIVGFVTVSAVLHLAQERLLPVSSRAVLLALAVATAAHGVAIALASGRARAHATPVPRPRLGRLLLVALVAVAGVGIAGHAPPAAPPGRLSADDELRIVVLDTRFGFGLDGRFAATEQAAQLRALRPDVVVLTRVDRGSLATGSHDVLAVHAAALGLPHVAYAATANDVWGAALLSRFPIAELSSERLPAGADPLRRSQFTAVLEHDSGQPVAVVGAQLSPREDQSAARLPQARAVAATVARLRERGLPTIVAGSLGAGPRSAEVESFTTLLRDTVPANVLTYPADLPTTRFDHVLASPELEALDTDAPHTTSSAQRPLVVTLRVTPRP